MAEKRDYYEVLGVSKSATDAELKTAYRQMAKKYHPDLNNGDKSFEEQFKEINEAYQVLSDPQKRARYDQFGHEDPTMGGGGAGGYAGGFGGGGGFGGFDDIFSAFFGGGGFGGAGGARQQRGPERGDDLRYDLSISFEEAAFGCEKEIQVVRNEKCDTCGGSGAKPGTAPEQCPTCHGSGQVRSVSNTPFGRVSNVRVCADCQGEGQIIKEPCADCQGRGTLRKQRKISFKIPAGIDNDMPITLRGQGEPGMRGGPNGDLYVYITVKPHKMFQRRDYDLYCDFPITFTQAALGAQVEIPTLTEPIKADVAEGTQPDTVIRLRGSGIQNLRGAGKGDMFVKLKVEVPRKLSEEQKNLLRQFDQSTTGKEYEGKRSFFERVKDAFNG